MYNPVYTICHMITLKVPVEFEWNDDLGERWFNMSNLGLLLYGNAYTKRELLSAKHIQSLDDDGKEMFDASEYA